MLAIGAADAAVEAEDYARLAATLGTRRAQGHLARMRALTAPRADAIELLEQACGHFAASPARLELARSLTELGPHRRAAGERRAARALLRDAYDAAHACLPTRSPACARRNSCWGRKPAARDRQRLLTPAERRAADIAAQGATNREIARRLYLSPKTVEMHLRSAYRKLDLSGREGWPPLCAGRSRVAYRGPARRGRRPPHRMIDTSPLEENARLRRGRPARPDHRRRGHNGGGRGGRAPRA